jgi:GT2 family glycosyltransferase
MSVHIQPLGVSKCTGFSIIIPTWCNLEFLKICLRSLREHSRLEHQVIVHLNDGNDGSRDYVRDQGLEYTLSEKNIGICYAVNSAAALARKEWLVFLNDDMYCCPGWDTRLAEKIEALGHDACMLSGTMIEPVETGNSCVSVRDFGRTTADFREAELLSNYATLAKDDWSGATWPPTVLSKRWWNAIGGFSSEFSPGMSSDNDLSMKMWHAGCRCFIGVGDSLVYHFISRSTGKIKKNNGRRQFFKKWGISQSLFDRAYLRRGKTPAVSELSEPSKGLLYRADVLRQKLKYGP